MEGSVEVRALEAIAKEQRPTKEYRDMCVRMANDVFLVLKASPQVKIDRVCIAGSIGKGTALGDEFHPDTDIVVFVNDVHPSDDKSDLLAKFKVLLEKGKLPGFHLKKVTRQSVQFSLKQGNSAAIEYDLCVAANMVPNHQARGLSQLAMMQEQAGNVRTALTKAYQAEGRGFTGYEFSSSLAEQTIEFMRSREEWVIDTIHLAKLWDKKITDIGYISGRSFMIELVAEAACKEAKEGGKPNVLGGLEIFLKKMADFDNIRVISEKYYKKDAVPSVLIPTGTVGAVVMDPVNPYNNLAERLDRQQVEAFKRYSIFVIPRLTKPELLKKKGLLFADQ